MQKREKAIKIKTYNTIPCVKAKYWPKFAKLIEDQFKFGGQTKYKVQGFDDREATDIISSVFGGETEMDWLLGTIMKYVFRLKTLHREKDWLKIVTYCYIGWLKEGNHLKSQNSHDTDTRK